MSILKQKHSDHVSPALRATTEIKNRTARLAETIIREWEHGFDALWNHHLVTPEEILAELGTDAAEVFELSAATVQFMAAILPGRLDEEWTRIQAKVAAKPATTVQDDGSVTIDPA